MKEIWISNARGIAGDVVAAGVSDPELERLARMGNHGKHVQNIERAYHRARLSDSELQLEPYWIKLTIQNPDAPGETVIDFPVFAPHEMIGLGPKTHVLLKRLLGFGSRQGWHRSLGGALWCIGDSDTI